ncbi:hypothetical protein F2Q69_00006836 [Brassica cretica]|uniref:Uncharacterized protein n=1 Tax=Brassica cretica TaxID=69181 RepID=A0A8S9P2H6_BRACR|nr:hypothetical protein F2Q69_00006836 [Brassica cretica]
MGVSAGDNKLGVVDAAAQRSRPVVPRLRGETDEYMIFGRIGATEIGGDGCRNLVSERGSVPAPTRDGD